MADVTDEGASRTQAPSTLGRRLRYAGPGIVIAVTGVGAGDMVSSLVAGTDFGMVLLWAVVLGAILKYFLTEGIGRWYMASGQTILQGWRSLGRWAIWYFVIYLFIVTFVFGAAVTSTAALAVDAALPGVLPLWAWAALHSVAAFIIVGIGRYGLFEMIMKTFAALKFGIVILLAILLAPALGEVVLGFVPRIPEGALINVLAIIGGVGGTYSLAAYTYWVRERGWRHSDWLIIGAELLFGTGTSISDEEGLLALVDPMQDRFGLLARWAFLIGFWAVATGAMLGAWNGGAYLFADCVRTIREAPDEEASDYLSEKSIFFRGFLAWMSFPPMILLAFGEPVLLVIVYASLGALFLPFLAITLLILLNSQRVAPEYRNRLVSNVVLAVSVIPFIVVGVQEVLGSL
jgi:Mn2+/Fe2+ NRAMP family transporter